MATLPSLPAALRDRLTAVARRIRFLRLIHGLSILVLVLTLTGAVCLVADWALHLDALFRVGLLAGWLMVGGVTALFAVVRPQFRRLDPQSLAAVVEEQYPELAERLLSAVELSGERGIHHGSPALIELLVDDATRRTTRLNLTRAVPAGLVAGLTVAALVLLTGVLGPAAIWPGQYGQLAQRFFAPWYTPPLDYAVITLQEDAFAARGRPLVLAARITPLKDDAALPDRCTLVLTDAAGRTERRDMTAGQDAGLFLAELGALTGDLSYHVESGLAKSDTFTVTAVEPVALAADSPAVTVTPPDYAKDTVQTGTEKGLVNLTALQHSRVKLELKLTQPAKTALVAWKNDGPPAGILDNARHVEGTDQVTGQAAGQNGFRLSPAGFTGERVLVSKSLWLLGSKPLNRTPEAIRLISDKLFPVELTSDGLGGTVEFDAASSGQFSVFLWEEHEIDTQLGPVSLTVRVDQPPAFHKVTLSDQLKAVLPHDKVQIG